jgi:hypothetical protein
MKDEPIAIPLDGTPESDAKIRMLALKHLHLPGPPLGIHTHWDNDEESLVFTYDGTEGSGLQAQVLAKLMSLDRRLQAAPVMQQIRDAGLPKVYQPG